MGYRFNPLPPRFDRVEGGSVNPDLETLTGDVGGAVGPDGAFNIDVIGGFTSDNNDNGLQTTGDPGANSITFELTNRVINTVTTTDATPTTINSLDMGATPATFIIQGRICGFNSSIPASVAYSHTGVFRTDGATATEVAGEFSAVFEEAALMGADIEVTASGNNIIVNVEGIATPINWKSEFVYTKVE